MLAENTMTVSQEDKAILAHVVIDPDGWVEHTLVTAGEWAVTAKIERYRVDYVVKKNKKEYKTRAEREVKAAQNGILVGRI